MRYLTLAIFARPDDSHLNRYNKFNLTITDIHQTQQLYKLRAYH